MHTPSRSLFPRRRAAITQVITRGKPGRWDDSHSSSWEGHRHTRRLATTPHHFRCKGRHNSLGWRSTAASAEPRWCESRQSYCWSCSPCSSSARRRPEPGPWPCCAGGARPGTAPPRRPWTRTALQSPTWCCWLRPRGCAAPEGSGATPPRPPETLGAASKCYSGPH